jgi:hypothetical protein
MKKVKILFALLIAIFSLSSSSFAQDGKKNIFKVNMISPIVRTGSFFYERAITQKSSLQLGVFYTGYSIDDTKLRGFGITPEYRFYLSQSKEAPQGFFVAPFVRYESLNLSTNSARDEATLSTFGGGVLIGGQWIFSNIISLDIFGGPRVNSRSFKASTSGTTEDDFTLTGFGSFGFRFGVTLGIAF